MGVDSVIEALKKQGVWVGRAQDIYKNAPSVEVFSTGSLVLDDALRVGGYPRGRIIEIRGAPGGGKTTMSFLAMAQVQKAGMNVAFIDAEHTYDESLASRMGVDISSVILSKPDHGEEAFKTAEELANSKEVGIVVIDSVAALVPHQDTEGEFEDKNVGSLAQMMSKGLRRLTKVMGQTNTILLFINQLRTKVAIGGPIYGSPLYSPGGISLEFYSSVRLQVRKLTGADEEIRDKGQVVGHTVEVKVLKNKVGKPFSDPVRFKLNFDTGVDAVDELVSLGTRLGVISLKGSHYSLGDKKFLGRNALYDAVKENTGLQQALRKAVLSSREVKASTKKDSSAVGSDKGKP